MAVYLDNNATTALDEAVFESMLPYMGTVTGNPSSVHRFGRLQRDAIEHARESVASLVGARAEQVIFTTGGTASNNLLLSGFSQNLLARNKGEPLAARIAMSAIEHMSSIAQIDHLPCEVDLISSDENGYIGVQSAEQAVTEKTVLMSVMAANNETGVIQDLPPLIDLARKHGCFFHTDASQAAGKIPLDFTASGIDAMTVSAHKLYGPLGVGALIVDKRLSLAPLQFGGFQEKGLSPGTENIPAIVGFGKAAELALDKMEARNVHVSELRNALEKGLMSMDEVTIFAQDSDRLANTVQFGVSGFDGETLLMQLDRQAIAVSSGSACTSGKTEPSHVLTAMKVPDELARSAVRVSFGKNNTMSDVESLLQALNEILVTNQHSAVMMAANV